MTDHPHAGGENISPQQGIYSGTGPSPRGWGKRVREMKSMSISRTIPTRVGKTGDSMKGLARDADHPHAGGEN